MDETDDEITRIHVELRRLRPVKATVRPEVLLSVAGLIQLAARHPGLNGFHQEIAARALAFLRDYFADCPTVLAVLERGEIPGAYRPASWGGLVDLERDDGGS